MCHSFVIGDVVIDHTIFVRDIKKERQQRGNEGIYEVLRRTDMAGGAANCARILAALSTGQTYLWGVVGRSHWGSFRAILEHSQAVDGSQNNIEFRGVRDETNAQMNTVTRLIVTRESNGEEGFRFGDRFDETHHLHIPPGKRETALYYLKRAHEKLSGDQKGKLDIILIDDFDLGCLTDSIVRRIAEFAERQRIPLFVNPRYENKKYKAVKGTAIIADLKEWCRLVGEPDEKAWRHLIQGNENLSGMAYRSFLHLGNFEFYVIRCEGVGTVFMGPNLNQAASAEYLIAKIPDWRIPSETKTSSLTFRQVGVTDVMMAVFAMEFHRLAGEQDLSHKRSMAALEALSRAIVMMACHRDLSWHRMPTTEDVMTVFQKASQRPKHDLSGKAFVKRHFGSPRKGLMYLPKSREIVLSDHKTCVPGFYSEANSEFGDSLCSFVNDFSSEDISKHIILSAPGGCGKTTLVNFLKDEAHKLKIDFRFVEGLESVTQTKHAINSFWSLPPKHDQSRARILAIDEALGCGFGDLERARVWLDEAKRRSVRFLLVDAGFTSRLRNSSYREQVIDRCHLYTLMTPDKHPYDIPYIVASLAIAQTENKVSSLQMQGGFLLAFIDGMINESTIRPWEEQMKQAMRPLLPSFSAAKAAKVPTSALPPKTKVYLDHFAAEVANDLWFEISLGAI